VRIQIMDAFNE